MGIAGLLTHQHGVSGLSMPQLNGFWQEEQLLIIELYENLGYA